MFHITSIDKISEGFNQKKIAMPQFLKMVFSRSFIDMELNETEIFMRIRENPNADILRVMKKWSEVEETTDTSIDVTMNNFDDGHNSVFNTLTQVKLIKPISVEYGKSVSYFGEDDIPVVVVKFAIEIK